MSWVDSLNNQATQYAAAGRNQTLESIAPKPQAKQAPGGLQGFLTGLLPLAGSVGGGLLGAFGGPAGIIAGGAAGGALGETAKEAINGTGLNAGDIATQGVLGAIPGVGAGLKGAVTAAKSGESILGSLVGKGASQAVAQTATGAGTKIGNALVNKGANTEAVASGFGVGEKAPGAGALGVQDSQKILQTLNDNGISAAGSARGKLTKVEGLINDTGKQIDSTLTKNNVPLTAQAKQQVVNDYLTSIQSHPGYNPAMQKQAETYATNFLNQAQDVKGMVGFRRGLDKNEISYVKNPDAATATKQQAASAFRDVLSQHTNDLAPGIADANSKYHDLTKAADYLKAGAKVATDSSQGDAGLGRVFAGETAQATKSTIGRGTQILGKLAGGVPAAQQAGGVGVNTATGMLGKLTAGNFLKGTVKQGAGRLLTGAPLSGGFKQPAQQPTDQGANIVTSPEAGATGLLATSPESQGLAPGDQEHVTPFTSDNIQRAILQDIQTTGGKNIAGLTALYNTFGKDAQPKTLNSTQQGQVNNSVSALKDINYLQQAIAKDPTLAYKDLLPTSIGHGLTGTTDYDVAKQNIVDVISRLRSGAAITADEAQRYMAMLPSAGDSSESAQSKLQRLSSLLGSFAQPSPAPTDLSSILAQGQ